MLRHTPSESVEKNINVKGEGGSAKPLCIRARRDFVNDDFYKMGLVLSSLDMHTLQVLHPG